MTVRFAPDGLPSLAEAFQILESGRSVILNGGNIPDDLPVQEAMLGLFSSGSTGAPKFCWHAWRKLKDQAVSSERFAGWTWASPFAPATFAGVQVALQAWLGRGTPVSLPTNPVRAWNVLAKMAPQALCCTPTFLDLLIRSMPRTAAWQPLQVTLGGEALRPAVGARFHSHFPKARFTAVYASAELGVMLKTSRQDGWYEVEEFARRKLDWRLKDGMLQIERAGEWKSTGDLAECQDGLIRIIGRADSVVNIAGVKISLEVVTRMAEEVNGVRMAAAFAEPNPVTGQIVALRFEPEAGQDGPELQARLEDHLRRHLRKEAWPRRFESGPIVLGPNAKRIGK